MLLSKKNKKQNSWTRGLKEQKRKENKGSHTQRRDKQ